MKQAHHLIVGAGFAGAATAFHLVRMGAKGVLILEREGEVGRNSSGLNAAMVVQTGSDEAMEAVARRGAQFIRKPPAGWPGSLGFSPIGSLYLASGEALKGREAAAGRARAAGVEAEVRTRAWAAERVPVLEGAEFEGALWSPSDGVVDIQALLRGFLEGARAGGAEVWLGCELKAVEVRNGRAAAAETGAGRVETGCLINAAGAWAGPVGEMAGAARLPLRPCRRHLFRTGSLSWAAPDWPLVWDVDDSHYFRPEAGGLLLSACDEEDHPPSLPDVEPAMAEVLREKLRRKVPRLQWLRFEASWACLRTLAPDDRFAVGWDPEVQGFFWAAGLGGHGATCSGALGEMAASLILGRKDPFGLGPSFDPARFLSSG